MSLEDDYQRVSRERPCPVCRKPDWCMVSRDNPAHPSRAICARVESRRRWGEAGWLHELQRNAPPSTRRIRQQPSRRRPRRDFGRMAQEWHEAIQPERLQRLAEQLGVSHDNLRRLGIGWSSSYWAWSFPMFAYANGRLDVVGIRLRHRNGANRSVFGSREGLFIPADSARGSEAEPIGAILRRDWTLFVCEGPTDTAAALDLGFSAIGRPSCTGGTKHVVEYVRRRQPGRVVIVADADEPGQLGAKSLASVIVAYGPQVKVLTPPSRFKDLRGWRQAGVIADEVEAMIDGQDGKGGGP